METSKLMQMQQHCDALTATGRELSVTWEGGGDQGMFHLLLDGQELEVYNEIEEQVITLIEDHLGYGSFAGEFSTDGKLVYDRQSKCFEGTDNYSQSDPETQEDCNIEFSIPETVWFDRLIVHISSDSYGEAIELQFRLMIAHGPYPDFFDELQEPIKSHLAAQFLSVIDRIEDFESVNLEYDLRRSELTSTHGQLHYLIEQFDYYKFTMDSKDISIGFQESRSSPLQLSPPLFP